MPDNFHGNPWKILPKWRSHVHAFCRFARDSACFCHLCAAALPPKSRRPNWISPANGNGPHSAKTAADVKSLSILNKTAKNSPAQSAAWVSAATPTSNDGTFKDGQITFKVTRSRGGQDITTTYTGKLQGDTIKGIVDTDMRGNKIPRRVGSAPREGRRAETGKLKSSLTPSPGTPGEGWDEGFCDRCSLYESHPPREPSPCPLPGYRERVLRKG